MPKIDFTNRVVVITGAGNGIGRAYAYHFGKLNAKMILNDLPRAEKEMNALVDELRAKGNEVYTKLCSVTEGDLIIQEAMNRFGRVDVLINNAGFCNLAMFEDTSDKLYFDTIDVNLHGTYKPLRAAWDIMLKQDYGRIINVTSPFGLYGEQATVPYCTSKGAVMAMTRSLSRETKGSNVHVNAIAPIAYTAMTEGHIKGSLKGMLGPELIAPLVGYLAHESCTENGAIYEVGGGWIGKVRWQNSSINLPMNHTSDDVAREIQKTHSFTENTEPHDHTDDSIRKMVRNARRQLAKL